MKTIEIDIDTLKKLMKHLSKSNSLLTVILKQKLKEEIHQATTEYKEWKDVGMEFEWHKRNEYFEKLIDEIDEEKQFYIKAVELMKNEGIKPEDWIC